MHLPAGDHIDAGNLLFEHRGLRSPKLGVG
jgi:hypothetical protein